MARANKPRKWSNLKGQIPDAPVEVSEHTEKIFAARDERRGRPLAELADEWADLEEEEAFAKLAEEKRNIIYAALEGLILDALKTVKDVAGTDMWRGERKTFSPQFTPRPTVKDPAALRKWIEDTGQHDQLSLSAPRLKAIVCEALDTEAAAAMTPAQRAQLKPGDPSSGVAPPGVEVFLQQTVHHTTVKRASAVPVDDEGPF